MFFRKMRNSYIKPITDTESGMTVFKTETVPGANTEYVTSSGVKRSLRSGSSDCHSRHEDTSGQECLDICLQCMNTSIL